MTYESSLSTAVQTHIRSVLARKILEANTISQIGSTALEIREYLTDPETISTPDFVIRRYIQAFHPGLLEGIGPVPDLVRGKRNVPWPEEALEELSGRLEKLSREQGAAISKNEWLRYFHKSVSNIREKVFRIAFTLKMDAEQTLDLLLAFDMEPYSVRQPLDMICLFCQKIGGTYTWAQAKQMHTEFMKKRPRTEGTAAAPSEDGTIQVLADLNALFASGLQGSNAQTALIDYMLEHSGEFISFRDKGKELFLPGYSLTRSRQYRRLTEYLAELYPSLIVPTVRKDKASALHQMDHQLWHNTREHVVTDGVLSLPTLVRAMFTSCGWYDLEWNQNADKGSFDERMRMFCHNYEQHIGKVNRLYTGGSNIAFFDRRDALLFIFFLIIGYTKLLSLGGYESEKVQDRIMDMTESGDPFDEAIGQALARAQAIFEDPGDPLRQFRSLCRCFDLILPQMGHVKLYLPSQFDRFILLALLSRDPGELSSLVMSEAEWESYEIPFQTRSLR